MLKVWGFIALTVEGKPVTDNYNNVLLFSRPEDARQHGDKVVRVVTAKITRKKAKK